MNGFSNLEGEAMQLECASYRGFLLEQCSPAGMCWRPSRFIAVTPTLEEARAAVLLYTGRTLNLSLIDQGAATLSRARELGVADGKVIALI